MRELPTAMLVPTGSLLILVAAFGLVRLPDVLCRSHAVAKAMTLGIFLMLFGLSAHLDGEEATLKIVLAICFSGRDYSGREPSRWADRVEERIAALDGERRGRRPGRTVSLRAALIRC